MSADDLERTRLSSRCAGCGAPVDPLRAAHVAILEGAFRYFCKPTCRTSFLTERVTVGRLDAMTAEPPPVASVASTTTEVVYAVTSVGEEPAREEIPRALPVPVPQRTLSVFPIDQAPRHAPSNAALEPSEHVHAPSASQVVQYIHREAVFEGLSTFDVAAPSRTWPAPERARVGDSVPPPAVASPDSAGSTGSTDWAVRFARFTPVVVTTLGVTAFAIGLAGYKTTLLQLVCAFASVAWFATHRVLRPRDPSEPSPWGVTAPVLGAAIGAFVSLAVRNARASGHLGFVGLAVAVAAVVDVWLSRAQQSVRYARIDVTAALGGSARVAQAEDVVDVAADSVQPGDVVVVEAPAIVPVDGIVVSGQADVAPWFRSSDSAPKREGDWLVAGAFVTAGKLRVKTTFAGLDRAWLRLLAPSSEALEVRAPLVMNARRVVEMGAPIAALLAGVIRRFTGGTWSDSLMAASAGGYAVVGGAAVVAASLAHVRGLIAAQQRGVVYKDSAAFDAAARAEVAVICSRGTLLLGEPELVTAEAFDTRVFDDAEMGAPGIDATDRVLSLAAGAEMAATDVLAAAILHAARARNVRPESVRSALVHPGLGVSALAMGGQKVVVGSRAFLLRERVSVAMADERVRELEAQGRTVLLVGLAGRLVGLLALQDGLRPGARAAVKTMSDAHIEPVLLSGEARDTCESIAQDLGIEHVRPEVLPDDRGTEVKALAEGGRVIAAIGHPSPDDGALGAADVSVAMATAGGSMEWSIALASDDVRDAACALTLARAAREKSRNVVIVAACGHALATLAVALGAVAPAVVAAVALMVAAGVLAMVRDASRSDALLLGRRQ